MTPPPTAQMLRVPAVRAVAESGASGPISATASCPGSHALLGGGYALSGSVGIQRAAVTEDYPSSVSAWTVTVNNATVGGPLTLTVYADCLRAPFSVTTQIIVHAQTVPNDASLHTVVAQCPMGTTLTGGGSRDAGSSGSPLGDGWQATYIPRSENPPATVRIFAVCASHNLQPGVLATAAQSVAVGGTATLNLVCPARELLVGGGYRYDGVPAFAFVDAPVSDFASWQVQLADQGSAGGLGVPGNLMASAVCVRIASPIATS